MMSGVTLPELMVVLAVVAILAAMALPCLAGLAGRSSLERQAYLIISHLTMARDMAVKRQEPWCVVFLPDRCAWYCHADPNRNHRADPGEASLGPYRLPQGLVFGSRSASGPNGTKVPADGVSLADNRVSFSPMGTCNAGTVYLRSRGSERALRIMPASGTVVVYERTGAWRVVR